MKAFLLLLVFGTVVIIANDEEDGVLRYQAANHRGGNLRRKEKRKSRAIPTVPVTDELKLSRNYRDVNDNVPLSFVSPEQLKFQDGYNIEFHTSNETNYEYFEEIGEGAFSKVYVGQRKNDSHPVVLKKFKSPKQRSVNREIMVLSHLRNSSKHIVNMIDAVRDFDNDTALLVYEYVDSISFARMAPQLKLEDLKYYMYQLATAIEESHKRGVMHRDVKMTNTIVNEDDKLLILIDWGLGEFYHPGKNYSCRVGTRYYKAPELLLGNEHYDYAVDMWSYGSVLAGLLFKKHPMFKGKENDDVLASILRILGSDDMWAYMTKYNLKFPDRLKPIQGPFARQPWESFINRHNSWMVTDDGLDLVSKLLVYDHKIRLTANETLNHKFFDSVRHLFKD